MKPIQVRGQAPEEPTPIPTNKDIRIPLPKEVGIRLPSPTDLGVGPATSSMESLSWDQVRQRLDRLGASKFQLEKVAHGYRFAFELPSGVIEASGKSENDAIRSALVKAESLVRK